MDYEEKIVETGIPCFKCGERSGIDCPGRKPDERTRCKICLDKFIEEQNKKHIEHIKTLGPTVIAFDYDEWNEAGQPKDDEKFYREATVAVLFTKIFPASLTINPGKAEEVCEVIFHHKPNEFSGPWRSSLLNRNKGITEEERSKVIHKEKI